MALGTGTDPYQACEGRYRITRRALEAVARRPMPLSIITKGTLIVRDLDVLRSIAERVELRIWSSITTVDAALAREIEPGAPPPAKRLEVVRRMRAAGLRSGVLLAPVVPGITDSEPAMVALGGTIAEDVRPGLPLAEKLGQASDVHDRHTRPGSRSLISWSSQPLPSGSLNEAYVR